MAVHDPSTGLLFSPSSRYPNPIAYLADTSGETVHMWSHSAWQPKPEDDPPSSMRGWNHVEVDAEGNLFAVVPLRALLKLSPDSELVWSCEVAAHHDLAFVGSDVLVLSETPRSVHVDGGSRVVLDNSITRIDENGVVTAEFSLYDVLRSEPALRTVVDRTVRRRATEFRMTVDAETTSGDCLWWTLRRLRSLPGSPCDVLHTNTLEVVDDHPSGLWQTGDVLVCMRELDTVAVVDPVQRTVRWSWGGTELSGPHQPSVTPDGQVLVFDNGVGRGWSRLLMVDPTTDKVEWSWSADPPASFFCPLAGGCELLANGNILVTHSAFGEVFELTPGGRTVWEWTLPPEVYGANRGRVSIYRVSPVPPSTMAGLCRDR
jgi:Arylsulfotransferase (ASST)